MANDDRATERTELVEGLRRSGITDERVLTAMGAVPRHRFVPAALAADAYDDRPLPIGHRATISQPFIVALMTEALRLRPTDHVLEVGTGSGYGAAVLAECAAHVTTVETVSPLVEPARRRLAHHGDRVTVIDGDGTFGHPPGAPYDAISVTAASPEVPPALLEQLAADGRLVAPVGRGVEELVRIERTPAGDVRTVLCQVRFVPLIARR